MTTGKENEPPRSDPEELLQKLKEKYKDIPWDEIEDEMQNIKTNASQKAKWQSRIVIALSCKSHLMFLL